MNRDEFVSRTGGKPTYLWRAVNDQGEDLDLLARCQRDTEATPGILLRLLRNQTVKLQGISTTGFLFYGAALSGSRSGNSINLADFVRQPRGELPPDDPTMRTPIAAAQIPSLSKEICHHPLGDLHDSHHPAPSDQQA